MKTFAFFYFMDGDPDDINKIAPKHTVYWRGQQLPGYQGGPFADWSGGMIIFQAPDRETAARLVAHDPFMLGEVLGRHWLKEWDVFTGS